MFFLPCTCNLKNEENEEKSNLCLAKEKYIYISPHPELKFKRADNRHVSHPPPPAAIVHFLKKKDTDKNASRNQVDKKH